MKIYSVKKLIKAKDIRDAIKKSFLKSDIDSMDIILEYDSEKEKKKKIDKQIGF